MVSTALFTGLSGLRVHQTYIDVIGNNLANVSTPGFRGSRATFSDILSFTVRAGSAPTGNLGGQNPMQIGHGAIVAARSVVAADVPPYAVAAGNPARVVRERFPPDVVVALLEIAWWDWPVEKVARNLRAIVGASVSRIPSGRPHPVFTAADAVRTE